MLSFKNYYNSQNSLKETIVFAPFTAGSGNLGIQNVANTNKNFSAELQKGGNPMIYTLWNTLKPKYSNIKSLGIWGNKEHQQRESDHNTGDAIDIGITNTQEGNNIVNEIINGNNNGPYSGSVKYVIFNSQIWYPNQGMKPYTGKNPHSTHVHVSFNRGGGESNQPPNVPVGPISGSKLASLSQ